jgi:signal transduction histidine kinase
MAALDMRNWFARTRTSKLSTRVIVLFGAALILPWCAYAWSTFTERSELVERTQHHLAALAAAYGEYATTLMRLGIEVPVDGAVLRARLPNSTEPGEAELTAFRSALKTPSVIFSLHRLGEPGDALSGVRGPPDAAPELSPIFSDRNGVLVAEVDRPAARIAAFASMSKDDALKDWRVRADIEGFAFLLRSLLVVGVGLVLVQQLRWREVVEAELVVAKQMAESASRAKSEFLANMSHELRTPLNAIIGFSEIIKSRKFGPASERYPDYASDIFNSGRHLLALINDILNLSKLEAGQLALQEEDVDLATTVEACINVVETKARRSKILLSVSLNPEIGLIRADELKLRQILINLLSNAVKFTPEGGHVWVSSAQENGGLVIAISDTGIGIAPEDIPKTLAPFRQVDSTVRRKQEGTGLGLPLAKQLVELHGGTLAIDSKVNVGTTVTFVLPAERIVATRARRVAVSHDRAPAVS